MQAYQTYGVDASGHVTHAGPHTVSRMTLRTAYYLQRSWLRWRRRYLATHPGNYPLRRVAPTVALWAHPVGRPSECLEYRWPFKALADARSD